MKSDQNEFLQWIYAICLTVFTFAAVEVGLDAFYPGKLLTYYQFVSLFSMLIAAPIMYFGLTKLKDTILGNSFMWAGIFIVVYGVASVFADKSPQFRFIVLALSLGITIFTGLLKFGNEPLVKKQRGNKVDLQL